MSWMEPLAATLSISSGLARPASARADSKYGLTSTSRSPSRILRVKQSAKSGSTPEEQPAMMESVPVGAMVVTVALR